MSSGSLRIRIGTDAAGALHQVTLPDTAPADLTVEHYSALLLQLERYPLSGGGGPFWRRVWARMAQIPWGHALTYGELAAEIGSPLAFRAVGQACAQNPLPLIVPCHRVLGNEGLGGFAYGSAWKTRLLELETEARPA